MTRQWFKIKKSAKQGQGHAQLSAADEPAVTVSRRTRGNHSKWEKRVIDVIKGVSHGEGMCYTGCNRYLDASKVKELLKKPKN